MPVLMKIEKKEDKRYLNRYGGTNSLVRTKSILRCCYNVGVPKTGRSTFIEQFFNIIFHSTKMLEQWISNIVISIYKNKGYT